MATWEPGKFTPEYRSREKRAFMRVVAVLSAVTVMLLGAGGYWVLRLEQDLAQAPAPRRVAVPGKVFPRAPGTAQARGVLTPPSVPARVTSIPSTAQPTTTSTVYILEFGRFGSKGAALARARLVRSKGYAARIARGGTSFRVLGREFRNQASAERWKGIFAEIGLPSRVKAHATAQRTITVTKFAVDFGKFKHRFAAETLARVVRSRGYVAKVARAGLGFHVLGQGYLNKARAEYWAIVFREIGLEASVTPIQESAQYPVN